MSIIGNKVIILCGGKGSRLWPYNSIRNKGMVPIVNKPLLRHTVDSLLALGCQSITIAGSWHMDDIRHEFQNEPVEVLELEPQQGNADTLKQCLGKGGIFLYGDCLIQKEDLQALLQADDSSVLLGKIQDDPHGHITALLENEELRGFIGHPRGVKEGWFMAGGKFTPELLPYLENCPGYFHNTKVGVGAPHEHIIENALNNYAASHQLHAVFACQPVFDLDRPWHILDANAWMAQQVCAGIETMAPESNGNVNPDAELRGPVWLGKDSTIGKGVLITGRCVVGNHTVIEHGVTIGNNVVIGDRCQIRNGCKIGDNSVIGDDCIIDQTAELLGGVVMNKNYLYHHGEFYGLLGERCDLGAGTVCGTLRFDDRESILETNGYKEIPLQFANAAYVGDFTRCGVDAILFPGIRIGTNCVIGPGTIVEEDLEDNKLLYVKQQQVKKEWSYKKYGW